jgi:DNA-binding transcriptional LysR family regulator
MCFFGHIVAMKTTVSPFHEMQVLATVVECGSFTSAAQNLDLPKSSISRRVTALEDRLGIRLLHRTTRSVRLTTAGEVYFETATRLMRELEDLETLVAGFADEPKGVLRITCPSGFASANAELFAELGRRFPQVRLAIEETDRFVDLVGEGFDLAFRGGRPPDAALSGFRLLSSERVAVAAPEYLQRRGRPDKLKSLADHDLLHLGFRHKDRWSLSSGRKEVEIEVMASFVTNNLRMLQQAAESGMGIALLPKVNCQTPLEEGRLIQVLPEWASAPATLWLVYPGARGLASSVRAFIDLVKEWPFLCM